MAAIIEPLTLLMRFRLRILIIAAALACQALWGQQSAPSGNQKGTPAASQRPSRTFQLPAGLQPGQTVTIEADQLTAIVSATQRQYQAVGGVQLDAQGMRLSADRMSYNALTGEATATGHVAFDSEAEQTHIEGTSASYNLLTSVGEFDDFQGVSGIRMAGRRPTSISANPLIFSGKKLERLGPSHYRLVDGKITSCTLPSPKWQLSAARVDIELGQNATLHDAVFRLFDVPVFYAPFLTHSTTRTGRHAGLLVPVLSQSNIKGYIIGDSVYWPVEPNVNLTLGGELLTSRGWADHLALASRPTRNSDLSINLDGVLDRGLPAADGGRIKQGGQELVATGDYQADNGFRTVLDLDYLSSYLYRLVFTNSFAQAINSEASSTGFTEKQFDGQDVAIVAHRYQDFLGPSPHANLSLAKLPTFDWNAYAQSLLRHLPLYFDWDANAGLLDRSEPGFDTGVMERTELAPEVRLPVSTAAGTFTGDIAVNNSYYSERQSPSPSFQLSGLPVLLAGGLWRNSVSTDLEWRPPALERVYSGPGGWLGDRIEHVFEPQVGFHSTSGISADTANEIIPFDDQDIVADTQEVEYGFTNRLLAAGKQPGQSRELISWSLLQKYYFDPTFGGALQPGQRNEFLTDELLSPFDIEAVPVRFSPLSSVIRVSPFTRFDGEWRLDYDSHDHRIAASAFSGNFHFGKGFFSGSHYMLRPPSELVIPGAVASFNQFRLAGGYGNASAPGYSIASSVAYDAHSGALQYTTLQLTRNWDCCGFSLEYRRFELATVRRENQFLISFNLANVGTFGNLKRQDNLF